ncbi:hypothetical protein ACFYXL_33070 [Streptomyces tsukubensis]|uniref:hypothetical protein n=1 Tax=Streptomyces tsukubensis TaxID=83656 RepID=UPI0036CEB45C
MDSHRALADRPGPFQGGPESAQWLLPGSDAICRYTSDWLATELRWSLPVDTMEHDRLYQLAAGCTDTSVTWTTAP